MAKKFKNWTIQEKLAGWLLFMGCEEIEPRSRYRVFKRKLSDGSWRFYFLGRNGAFRIGASAAATKSRSHTYNQEKFDKWCEEQEAK